MRGVPPEPSMGLPEGRIRTVVVRVWLVVPPLPGAKHEWPCRSHRPPRGGWRPGDAHTTKGDPRYPWNPPSRGGVVLESVFARPFGPRSLRPVPPSSGDLYPVGTARFPCGPRELRMPSTDVGRSPDVGGRPYHCHMASDFIVHDLGNLKRGQVVEVALDKAANVRLLDSSNFGAYRNGRQHR